MCRHGVALYRQQRVPKTAGAATNLATTKNDVPPVLPEALASALANIYFSTAGPLNAAGTIGAAMLIAGVATLARWWRGRPAAASRVEIIAPTADPTLP
jgi:hypothetical protein